MKINKVVSKYNYRYIGIPIMYKISHQKVLTKLLWKKLLLVLQNATLVFPLPFNYEFLRQFHFELNLYSDIS